MKDFQNKVAGQVGTQRDYRDQQNLLRDRDLEKLTEKIGPTAGLLSSTGTFRNPASARDHANSNTLNTPGIQSPHNKTFSIISPRSSQRHVKKRDHEQRKG